MKIVLGSKSARRSELLNLIGIDFYVDAVDVDEHITNYNNPYDYVKQVVIRKGEAVKNKHPHEIVVCADTIVAVSNEILGKPVDKADAKRMLELMSGKPHEVLTAVYLAYQNKVEMFVESTTVYIDNLTEEEITAYINTKEPYDKAGAYAIQGIFAKHIKAINGDYYNVMGLPINKLYNKLKQIQG